MDGKVEKLKTKALDISYQKFVLKNILDKKMYFKIPSEYNDIGMSHIVYIGLIDGVKVKDDFSTEFINAYSFVIHIKKQYYFMHETQFRYDLKYGYKSLNCTYLDIQLISYGMAKKYMTSG